MLDVLTFFASLNRRKSWNLREPVTSEGSRQLHGLRSTGGAFKWTLRAPQPCQPPLLRALCVVQMEGSGGF
jgi:hypothetical protein